MTSYRIVAFCVLRQQSLTPVSAHFLHQESIPSVYLRQATCVTLGVMLNFDATRHFAAKRRTQQALYEATFMVSSWGMGSHPRPDPGCTPPIGCRNMTPNAPSTILGSNRVQIQRRQLGHSVRPWTKPTFTSQLVVNWSTKDSNLSQVPTPHPVFTTHLT